MPRILIVALLALTSCLAGGALAANASIRIARNPVSAADWKIWSAMDADIVRLNHSQLAPEYAKCAKLKRAAAIGICDVKPLSQQARRISTYVTSLREIGVRSRPGQCRTAMARYELTLQATVSEAIVVNKELILTNKALWKSARTLESQIKTALRADRADAERLCKP